MLKYNILELLCIFFIFCTIGWVQESTIESIYHKRFINRGFLKGPYIPIYGIGGMTMLILCVPFRSNGFLVYIVGLVSCTTLEYFVGWLMETAFHKQFWDYSMLRITYKNRISLLSSLFWGLLSLFMVYVLYGIVDGIIEHLDIYAIMIYDTIMLTAMTVDAIVSVASQSAFREKLKKLPYEKAKRIMTEKFIEMGGAVMKRRERFSALLSKMKFSVEENDIEENYKRSESESEDESADEEIREG